MRRRTRNFLASGLLVVGAALGAVFAPGNILGSSTATGTEDRAIVTAVVDGDTIHVDLNGVPEKVRLIGVNTPEIHRDGTPDDCYAQEAREWLDARIWQSEVVLRSDPSQADRDRYGRLLRHVEIDGMNVARALINGGYGREYTYRTAYDGQSSFQAAERAAQSARNGIWGVCDNTRHQRN